jgi:hypothetical protein
MLAGPDFTHAVLMSFYTRMGQLTSSILVFGQTSVVSPCRRRLHSWFAGHHQLSAEDMLLSWIYCSSTPGKHSLPVYGRRSNSQCSKTIIMLLTTGQVPHAARRDWPFAHGHACVFPWSTLTACCRSGRAAGVGVLRSQEKQSSGLSIWGSRMFSCSGPDCRPTGANNLGWGESALQGSYGRIR